MWKSSSTVCALITTFLTGCAGIDYKPYPVPEPATGKDVGGIVYYDDSPYLIVWPDGKGNVQWQLQFLPDQTKKRIASPYNCVASLTSTLNFTNGVLTQSSVSVDDTALLKSIETAVGTVLSAPKTMDYVENKPGADLWIFKLTLQKETNSSGYIKFASASKTIVVPTAMTGN